MLSHKSSPASSLLAESSSFLLNYISRKIIASHILGTDLSTKICVCVCVCIRRQGRYGWYGWSWKSSPFPLVPACSRKVICMRLCLLIPLVQAARWCRQNIALQNQWRSRLGIHFLWRSGLLIWLEQEATLSSKPSLIQNWRHVKMWDRAVLGKAQMFFLRPTYH